MWVYPNNWIPSKSLEEMAKTDYDVLIVGSGAGGGATLYRLCELWKNKGAKRIGILEKGNKLFHSHSLNIPTMNVNRMRDQLWPDNSTNVGARLPEFSGARLAFALGGRTLFWNAACPRPAEFQLKSWPINQDELDVYYRLAERVLTCTTHYADGSSIQRVMMNRLHAGGIVEATDLPLAIDLSGPRRGEIHSNAWFSSINFLAYALNDKPFDLALNAYTTRVLVANGRATGVNVVSTENKKAYTIRAKNVVVSASTLETPRILLNSKIPGPAIGRYLTNHSFVLGTGTISRRQFSENIGNLAILKRETRKSPYQIQIIGPNQYFSYQQFEDKVLPDQLSIVYAAFGVVESRKENRVYLTNERDEYGVPLNQVKFSYSDKDQAVINQMREGIRQSAAAMGVTLDGEPTLMPPGSDVHESCTCRMGTDPATSATNRYGEIHGVSGLYVADNSMIPLLAAANPTNSTVALAIRMADHIVRNNS